MKKNTYQDQIVWIIGASSGIGAALAKELSKRGARLALSARRKEMLEAEKVCLGQQHQVFPLDVRDSEKTLHTAQAIYDMFGRIDRIVFLAAAYTPMKIDELDLSTTKAIIESNLVGAFHVVHAALSVFKTQKCRGQLALCGSVAGYIGLPGSQPYGATKAAIINLAESLYAEFNEQIDIKLINPGFVRTPLTDKNDFKMPMRIEPEQAAKEIADGLLSQRFEIHFPKKFTVLLKILHLLPYILSLRLMRKISS